MIDNGLGLALVPWAPTLEKHLGRHVSGVAKERGGIEWGFGPRRGVGDSTMARLSNSTPRHA
jgi:hypothetical protein